MNPIALPPPTAANVSAAALRLQNVAHRTPVLRSGMADELLGAQVFFKCENLQRTGSFKFRGAYNALAQLDAAQRERGRIVAQRHARQGRQRIAGRERASRGRDQRVHANPVTLVTLTPAPAGPRTFVVTNAEIELR